MDFGMPGQISAGNTVTLIALGDGAGVSGNITDAGFNSGGFASAPKVVAIAFGNISGSTPGDNPFTVNATTAAATGEDLSSSNPGILDGTIGTALGGGASSELLNVLIALEGNLRGGPLGPAALAALTRAQNNAVTNAAASIQTGTEIEAAVVVDTSGLEVLNQITLYQIEEGTTEPWYMFDDVLPIEASDAQWEEFIESVIAILSRQSAWHYPIVFLAQGDDILPAAVLGFGEEENLFVAGHNGTAITCPPMFAVIRLSSPMSQESGTFTLCIDQSYVGCQEQGKGERLFLIGGGRTPFLEQTLAFVQQYQVETAASLQACKQVSKLALV